MKVESSLFRELGERPLPREMLLSSTKARGRPKREYRPVIRTAQDVERLRQHRVPAFLLTSEWVTSSGYPVRFQPWLALPERLSAKV